MQPQGPIGVGSMGSMGGSVRPPGKSGLTFNCILSCLHGGLQKSRETGIELHSLNGSANETHDTLCSAMVSALAALPQQPIASDTPYSPPTSFLL